MLYVDLEQLAGVGHRIDQVVHPGHADEVYGIGRPLLEPGSIGKGAHDAAQGVRFVDGLVGGPVDRRYRVGVG